MRLQDIADRLKVSLMTVSRAFNHPDRVNAELRQRILACAAEIGYAPDLASRSMAARRPRFRRRDSRIILLQMGQAAEVESDPFCSELATGLLTASDAAGLTVERLALPPGLALDQVLAGFAQRRAIDGLLIDARGQDLDGLTLPARVPTVTVFRHAGQRCFASADIDRTEGAGVVTQALVRAGYRRPGFLAIEQVSSFSNHGYLDAFQRMWPAAGLQPVPPCTPSGSLLPEALVWFAQHRPDVIVALSPPISANLFAEAGWRIPEDVAFVSLDVTPGQETCAGLSCRRGDLAGLGLHLLLNDERIAGVPDARGLRLLIPPRWRDGTSLPMT